MGRFDAAPAGMWLNNDDWGFESNCFVCESTNEAGLRIPFYADAEEGVVTARFTLSGTYSGAPTFIHGGITMAVLDEAQAWATIALGGKFAVTTETTTRFRRPVIVDGTYEVRAWLTEQGEKTIFTAAEVRDEADEVCASTTATFVVLSEAVASTAIGQDLADEHLDYVREPPRGS
jgi:uncharacterized protein (TIGR00369 family)